MKINNFRGDLTDVPPKKDALVVTPLAVDLGCSALAPDGLLNFCMDAATILVWANVDPYLSQCQSF